MYTKFITIKQHVRDIIDGAISDVKDNNIYYSTRLHTKKACLGVGSVSVIVKRYEDGKTAKVEGFNIYVTEQKDTNTAVVIITNKRGIVLYYTVILLDISDIPEEQKYEVVQNAIAEKAYEFLDDIIYSTIDIVLSPVPRRRRKKKEIS